MLTRLTRSSLDSDANLPFLFSHLTLLPSSDAAAGPASSTIHPAGTLDVVVDASAPNPQPMRMLYGTLVSSPHELVLHPAGEDEPKRGVFFVFPDVSVRMRGTYRLGVGLMRIAAYVPLVFCSAQLLVGDAKGSRFPPAAPRATRSTLRRTRRSPSSRPRTS